MQLIISFCLWLNLHFSALLPVLPISSPSLPLPPFSPFCIIPLSNCLGTKEEKWNRTPKCQWWWRCWWWWWQPTRVECLPWTSHCSESLQRAPHVILRENMLKTWLVSWGQGHLREHVLGEDLGKYASRMEN